MATLSELIRHDPPISTGATAVYTYSPQLERKYRFVSRFDEEVLLHYIDKEKGLIHLPRGVCPIGEDDQRDPGEPVVFPKRPEPREHQVKMFGEVAELVKNGQSGVVVAPTGFGKSPHPDEPILMFDGSIKKARDVHQGDLLMGPDSLPRTVTNVNFGYGPMVRIIPNKGEAWRCNDVHMHRRL